MKTLSIKQPYASLIMTGFKKFETRSWPTDHRGRLAIHASSNTDMLYRLRHREYEFFWRTQLECPTRVILGTVRILDCIPARELFPSPFERRWGHWKFTDHTWAWELADPEWLDKPHPWRGSLGLFETPDSIYHADAYGQPPPVRQRALAFPF